MNLSFNWLKEYITVKNTAADIAETLTLSGLEVEKIKSVQGDCVFEIEITTNRPDWLSHVGVAREIHACLGGTFKFPEYNVHAPRGNKGLYAIHIPKSGSELCPYYSGVLL